MCIYEPYFSAMQLEGCAEHVENLWQYFQSRVLVLNKN